MGCIERIGQYASNFTKTDEKIADYIKQHSETIPYLSVESLAGKADVSPAAIIRFMKRLQYNSFAECKMDIVRNDIKDVFNITNFEYGENDSVQNVSRKIGALTVDSLTQTIEMLNYLQLEQTVSHLRKAEKIILFGIGASGLVAMDFQYKLLRIQKNCLYTIDSHTQIVNADFASESDVAVGFSYSGETKEVVKAMGIARNRGAYTVCITSNPESALSKLCDTCHVIPHIEEEFRLGAMQSRFSQLLISDILFTGIAQENLEKTKNSIIRTRMLLQ